MKYIKGASIITETDILKNHILGFDTKFRTIKAGLDISEECVEIIDAEGLYIAPGLIDVHIHGCGGRDTMEGTAEAMETISKAVAKNGVTAFLATTMTMDWDRISCTLNQIRLSMKEELPGAQLIGAHLEGPFINIRYKGAQNPEYIIAPSWELIEPYKDVIKIVTLAPELDGAKKIIQKLKDNNIVASMGHSSASYEQAMEGIDVGISHCTHLFNAMTGIHHRNPGMACAALSSDIYCEMIADTIHVHPGVFELVKKAKGIDRIILITDCMEAGGMVDGTYSLGGQIVSVKGGAARLADGTLAGSILKLNQALYNFYKNTDTQLHEVFRMGSLNPAKELMINDKKGSVSIGKDADFILIDEDFNVKSTYIKGKCIYD
ncbi:MAG: N-acetylglucosamine-6-phosphate deacetylase [Acetivibrionales bacterium]